MDLVSKIKQLVHLSPEGEAWLLHHTETFSFKKNEEMLSEGRVCNYLYFINSGVLCSHYMEDDKEVCSWIAVQQDFATSYYSFIAQKPSYESIVCLADSTVQGLSYAKLHEMYNLFPESERAGRLILEEYY